MEDGAIKRGEVLARLRQELPALKSSDSQEEQARAVLHWLLEKIAAVEKPLLPHASSAGCANCGRPMTGRSPYCGPLCKEEAAFVRQFRAGLENGSILDQDRQVAFGQSLWHIMGGGRPLRRAMIPEKVIAKVIEKAGGLCAGCGGAATTIDHIGTACNRPINLRPACESCCRTRPFGDPSVIYELEFHHRLGKLAERIVARQPLRPCDDPETWNWRGHVALRES